MITEAASGNSGQAIRAAGNNHRIAAAATVINLVWKAVTSSQPGQLASAIPVLVIIVLGKRTLDSLGVNQFRSCWARSGFKHIR